MRLDFLRRWLNEPLLAQLEGARRDLAVAESQLGRAESDLVAAHAVSDTLKDQLVAAFRLVGEMKRAGFVADVPFARVAPQEESADESQLWEAIYQRAPQGSGLAAALYQHAQQLLAAEESIEHVIGSILEGGAIDMDDLEERGA